MNDPGQSPGRMRLGTMSDRHDPVSVTEVTTHAIPGMLTLAHYKL